MYGIYEDDELIYIGSTTKGLLTRLGGHYASQTLMGQYMKEKGRDQFTIKELRYCLTRDEMLTNERYLICHHQPKNNINGVIRGKRQGGDLRGSGGGQGD